MDSAPARRNNGGERRETMDRTNQAWRNILAVIIGLGPIYGYVIASHIITGGSYTLKQMLIYPLVFGTATIAWIGFLYRSLGRKEWRAGRRADSRLVPGPRHDRSLAAPPGRQRDRHEPDRRPEP
jgi:hypothetical protein